MEMQYSVHKYSRSFCSLWRAESSRSQKLRRENCGYCGAIPVSWLIEGANCILIMSWHLCGVRTGNGGGAVRFARFTAHTTPPEKPKLAVQLTTSGLDVLILLRKSRLVESPLELLRPAFKQVGAALHLHALWPVLRCHGPTELATQSSLQRVRERPQRVREREPATDHVRHIFNPQKKDVQKKVW